jgi:hypothetical protein
MYNALFREFLTFMMEDPRNITACMHLHFIAKNIERMGDHVTSIAEQVVYLVTGDYPEESRPKATAPRRHAQGQGVMSADQPRVLVVEDEPAQREVLAYNLEAEGFASPRPRTATRRCFWSTRTRPMSSCSTGCCPASRGSRSAAG